MTTPNIFTRLSLIAAAAICLLSISPARAQSNRTWVAPSGDDNNPGTNAKPCKTFAGALAKTNAGGEIVVKESGGFGRVTINKSITIDGGGKYAGIQVSGNGNSAVAGVKIQAGNNDVIVLRGLTIKGLDFGTDGVDDESAGVLHVENCAISGVSGLGIFFVEPGTLFVQDTVISECALGAIHIINGGSILIERSRLKNNGQGISSGEGAQVTVRSTVASGNAKSGFETNWGTLNLENCVASNNGSGVVADQVPLGDGIHPGPAIVVISNSVVTNNLVGLLQTCCAGGFSDQIVVMYSRGNNTVTGNGTDISGTITPLGGS